MKVFRNIFRVLVIGAMVFLASCADEDDPTGTGDARDKFTGTWTVNETSQQQGNSTYTMTIIKDPGSASQVIAKNFYALGSSTETYIVINGNSMNIPTQQVGTPPTTVSGSGSYSNGNLTINFSADDGQTVDQVTINASH